MFQLAYLSSTRSLLLPEEIEQILLKSRVNNSRRDITGMLLYKGGNVLQILEGEKEEVLKLFAHIGKDDRHHGVIRLYEKTVAERDFPKWTMGFSDLNADGARQLEGYSAFLRPDFNMLSLKPSEAAELMNVFKTRLR